MPWLRGRRTERSDPHDEWMATAVGYANQLNYEDFAPTREERG